MRGPFDDLLSRRRAVLFDGALATELERHGAVLASRLWSAQVLADNPAAIRRVHKDALEAGADVISTATYQASAQGFADAGRSDGERLMEDAVRLAREAVAEAGRPALVAASLGPLGAVLADGSEFTGDYPHGPEALESFHAPRVEAVLRGGPDLVLLETLPSLAECEAVARLSRRFAGVPFMASVTVRNGALAHGEPFSAAVALLDDAPGVVALGINCSAPDAIAPLLASARPRQVLLGASPNSGEVWDAVHRRWTGSPAGGPSFAAWIDRYLDAGARIVGGCCRTTPRDIAAARARIDARGPGQTAL